MEYVNEKLEEFNQFLDGKKVAIIGMGVSNMPLLDYFYNKNAKVTIFDKNSLSDEIMEKVKNEFSKETKQREDFEENVFNLIEDTCTKLATSNLDN